MEKNSLMKSLISLVSISMFLLVFFYPLSGEAAIYSLQIDQAASIIHTSGGFAGSGFGDINIWGTIEVTTSAKSIQFGSSGIKTSASEFVFPAFEGTYDGKMFSSSQEVDSMLGLYDNYSGTFDGTTLLITGCYHFPAYDGFIYDYTVKATPLNRSTVPIPGSLLLLGSGVIAAIARKRLCK